MKHTCTHCGGSNVKILIPAWVDADSLNLAQLDTEAEPLGTFCSDCQEDHPLTLTWPDGREQPVIGRWATA